MTKIGIIRVLFAILMTSCVSKKKLNQVENQKIALEQELSDLRSEQQNCNDNYVKLEEKVLSYTKLNL